MRAQAATDRRLELALWQLDRRLTGDVQLQRVGVPALVASVRRALDAHAEQERALVTDLSEHLTPEQRDQLGQDLARALLRAPTRPHPDTHHGRLAVVLGRRHRRPRARQHGQPDRPDAAAAWRCRGR